jgi:hypothetical protein
MNSEYSTFVVFLHTLYRDFFLRNDCSFPRLDKDTTTYRSNQTSDISNIYH